MPSLESNATRLTLSARFIALIASDAPTELGSAEANMPARSVWAVSIFSAAARALARSDMPNWRATIRMFGNSLDITSSKPFSRSMVDALPGAFITTATFPLP